MPHEAPVRIRLGSERSVHTLDISLMHQAARAAVVGGMGSFENGAAWPRQVGYDVSVGITVSCLRLLFHRKR